jgi:DNA/RNA non-specific endonuclease/Domain of unknown function (DUF4157)
MKAHQQLRRPRPAPARPSPLRAHRRRQDPHASCPESFLPARTGQSGELLSTPPGHAFDRIAVFDPRTRGSVGADAMSPLFLPMPGSLSFEESDTNAEEVADPHRLIDAATAGPSQPLPHRKALEAAFGRPLAGIKVYTGRRVREALRRLGAFAAARGRQILLGQTSFDLETLVHEVIHVLQAEAGPSQAEPIVADQASSAEREANALARSVSCRIAGRPEQTVSPSRTADGSLAVRGELGAQTLAFRRDPPPEAVPAVTPGPQPAEAFASARAKPRPPDPAKTETTATEQPAAEKSPARPEGKGKEAGPAGGTSPEAALELPPDPEPGVTAEDVAAREQALAEASAAIAAAADVADLVDAFAAAPPTVKAQRTGMLGGDINSVAQEEDAAFQKKVPDFHAKLSGEIGPDTAAPVQTPGARDVQLEESPPAPVPDFKLPPTPDPGVYAANKAILDAIARLFGGDPTDRAKQVGETLRDVRTTDPDLETSPGPPPPVPLEGETDPERLEQQTDEGVRQAKQSRDEAQRAVVDGPGPERVKPLVIDAPYSLGELPHPAAVTIAPVDGPEAFLAQELPPEVRTAFDMDLQLPMQESMGEAQQSLRQTKTERDEGRKREMDTAEQKADEATRKADEDQRTKVVDARKQIQEDRQTTLDKQTKAVEDLESDIGEKRSCQKRDIDARVKKDEQTIKDEYTKAEREAEEKEREAERKAEEKKREAEREAEDKSWWERAVDFVKDAFNALADAIGAIFDAIRSAVGAILDAVKAVAEAIIDGVASFIKGAIAVFGEILKAGVNLLLKDTFPGLAKEINDKIDGAVEAAQAAVDVVADGLKAGIEAVVGVLKAGLNAVLGIFEAAIQIGLGFVEASITGDWSALARKTLEAVLKVAGVSKDEFYGFIGRAEETFQIIVDDPLGFLGHCVDAVVGGVTRFASDFLTHLKKGIIGWLTGQLGKTGIQLPERFDLMGVLSLVQQILGLTWDRLREKVVKQIGEKAVEVIEFIWGYIETLIQGGWPALFEKIREDLSGLVDTVLGGIKDYLLESIVWAALQKLATMFNPVGAIVQLVITAWRLYTFLRDQLQRIIGIVKSLVDAIGDIARGVIEPAAEKVEGVLSDLLPLAIDLLARLFGIGGVGEKVREIIEGVQKWLDEAIGKLIDKVKALFRPKGKEDPKAEAQHGQVIEESLQIGVEVHLLRAAVTDGRVSIQMASKEFLEIPARVEILNVIYLTGRGSEQPPLFGQGSHLATKLEGSLKAIQDDYNNIIGLAAKEPDEVKQTKILRDGLDELNRAFSILGQPPLDIETERGYQPPTHRFDAIQDGIGRVTAAFGDPISSDSLGRGSRASVNPPGIYILRCVPGFPTYERGHLLANRLGGEGNRVDNLAPMHPATNDPDMKVGPEKDAGDKIEDTSVHPPYILTYTIRCRYRDDSALRTLLTKLQVSLKTTTSVATAAKALYADAAANTDLTEPEIDTVLGVGGAKPTASDYNDVRKALAYCFMPHTFMVEIKPVQGPALNITTYTVLNHRGVTLP